MHRRLLEIDRISIQSAATSPTNSPGIFPHPPRIQTDRQENAEGEMAQAQGSHGSEYYRIWGPASKQSLVWVWPFFPTPPQASASRLVWADPGHQPTHRVEHWNGSSVVLEVVHWEFVAQMRRRVSSTEMVVESSVGRAFAMDSDLADPPRGRAAPPDLTRVRRKTLPLCLVPPWPSTMLPLQTMPLR